MKRIVASIVLSAAWIAAIQGQTPEPGKPVEVEITPRAIEEPILKYRLLPREDERKPGNAVPILLRLPWEQTRYMNSVFPELSKWDELPVTDPKWKTFDALPNRFFLDMKRAAYRRDAHWEYPIGEEPAMFILLPDVQGLRGFLGYGLSARAKHQISKGEWEEALDTAKVGLANAKHIAATPFVINQLVAVAIQRSMLDRALETATLPQCPNLYWAFSQLSGSLVNLEATADLESEIMALTFPVSREMDKARTPAEWKALLEKQEDYLRSALGLRLPKGEERNKAIEEVATAARAELPAMFGLSRDKVNAMSSEEAFLRWLILKTQKSDAFFGATLTLPPREALPLLVIEANRKDDLFKKYYYQNVLGMFKNHLNQYLTLHGLERKIALLRVIEAVRHHAAKNQGKLPMELSQIKGVPVPLDPLTDQPFVWKVEGNQATLSPPAFSAEIQEIQKTTANPAHRNPLEQSYLIKVRPN